MHWADLVFHLVMLRVGHRGKKRVRCTMLLVRIIEYNKIQAYLGHGILRKG